MSAPSKDVLIVEDATDLRMVIRKALEKINLNVAEAESVEAALEILKKNTPHLIILDLNLPKATGFDFLNTVKNIPIIVSSGLSDKESIHEAVQLGAKDYLIKPYSPALLIQKVRKQIQDSEYQKRIFDAHATHSQGLIHLPVKISRLMKTGFTMESVICIAPNQELTFPEDLIESMGWEGGSFKTNSAPPSPLPDGHFENQVKVTGLKPSLIKKFLGKPADIPELHTQITTTVEAPLRILEMDEFGITIECAHLLRQGSIVSVESTLLQAITKRKKPALLSVVNPDLDTNKKFQISLKFDVTDTELMNSVRKWILGKMP